MERGRSPQLEKERMSRIEKLKRWINRERDHNGGREAVGEGRHDRDPVQEKESMGHG